MNFLAGLALNLLSVADNPQDLEALALRAIPTSTFKIICADISSADSPRTALLRDALTDAIDDDIITHYEAHSIGYAIHMDLFEEESVAKLNHRAVFDHYFPSDIKVSIKEPL